MFEITPDDIARLDDEKLRAVIARLCEAELRRHGFGPSCVTWGGNQNAADGGIDVRVALPFGTAINGFVPRPATGFQVKQQDMPRTEILEEMHPAGVVRPSIQALADQSGAYIIVSSQGSTADTALVNRRDAMKEAIEGLRNADRLLLDFYDRTRIATWVRTHEALIPWVREQSGRAITGWHSYGSWAYPTEPTSAEYLLDETLRIHPSKRDTGTPVSALEGIRQIRDQLRDARSVVRLVGLSGVGKTRLVQALFDDRVGGQCLNPALAIYANVADSPHPQPIALASALAVAETQAILVIDNCPPELHQRLSEVCRQERSKLSVLTVEYDIREDEPEGTEVFTLETSSSELIEKLLRRRFSDISQIDARTIAQFSGGNARIAIALAATIDRNGTVAGLTDDQLFQRLFLQRHAPDQSLYLVAQACALVYSFEGEDVSSGDAAELIHLGAMIERTPQEVYRCVAELQQRDLVQQRGAWRAVLPHAIANRLAAMALKMLPYAAIEKQLVMNAPRRLMKSFSRRLGYLHASKEAQAIVKTWLGEGGLLGNVPKFNDLGVAMFENVAPVSPEGTLSALERACAEQPGAGERYLDLLRSLAYDPAHFSRCVTLMAAVLLGDEDNERSHGRQVFTSLFQLCLSGTHASIEQRVSAVDSLLASSDPKRRTLGTAGLNSALEAWQFNSISNFDFGARPRDFGYWPRTTQDVKHWFATILKLVEILGCDDGPIAMDVRAALAQNFRGLWHRGNIWEELAVLCRKIASLHFWPEGWLAVRQTLDVDGKGMDADRLAQLVEIEQALRPADLEQKVQSIVFSTRLQGVDFEEFEEHAGEPLLTRMARGEEISKELGKAVAVEEKVLAALLPALVTTDGRLWSFGEGLLNGAADPTALWNRLVTAVSAEEESRRKPQVLRGFLSALYTVEPVLANALLDGCVEHQTLSYWYPFLQAAVPIDDAGVVRLRRSVAGGKTPAHMFINLAYGRATGPIPPPDLKEVVLAIAGMQAGYDAAVEILHMRIFSDKDRKDPIGDELVEAGCELLLRLRFTTKNDREDYRIGEIARDCLTGTRGCEVTTELCARLKAAVMTHKSHAFYHDDLLCGLFNAQPVAALQGLCGGNKHELERGVQVLRDVGSRKQPLSAVSEPELLGWCDQDPVTRYLGLACVIDAVEQVKDMPPRWTSLALRFLERAPDPAGVLDQFISQFMPRGGWSGTLAAILESNVTLLDQLEGVSKLSVVVPQAKTRLQEWIAGERRREAAMDRQRDERFE